MKVENQYKTKDQITLFPFWTKITKKKYDR